MVPRGCGNVPRGLPTSALARSPELLLQIVSRRASHQNLGSGGVWSDSRRVHPVASRVLHGLVEATSHSDNTPRV